MKILNPIALVSWHIFGSISLADVGSTFFVRRRLNRVSVHGPGSLLIGGATELVECTFFNCDFIAAPADQKFHSAFDANHLKAHRVYFSKVTIITTQDLIDGIHRTRRRELNADVDALEQKATGAKA